MFVTQRLLHQNTRTSYDTLNIALMYTLLFSWLDMSYQPYILYHVYFY